MANCPFIYKLITSDKAHINLYKQLFSFDETVDAIDVGAAALASDIGWILVMMTSSSSVRLYDSGGVVTSCSSLI